MVVCGGGVPWQVVGVGGANLIDRRSVDGLTAYRPVFYSFCLMLFRLYTVTRLFNVAD